MNGSQNWKRNTFLLAFAMIGTSASYTMLIPFLPLYLLDLGTPAEAVTIWSGAVFSITFLIAAVMAPVWGKFADEYGKKRMAVRAAIGLTVAYFLGGLVTSPWELLGVRAVQGFANGFFPAALSIASSLAPKRQMGYALGVVQTGQIIGTVLGPLIGGIISEIVGMRMSFFVAATFLFLVVLLVIIFVDETNDNSQEAKEAHTSIIDDFRYAMSNRIVLLMLSLGLMVCLTNMVLQPVISLYVAQLQHSFDSVALHSGIIFSLGGIAGILSTTAWGTFGQRKGYFLVIALAFMGGGICILGQFFADSLLSFGILQFLFGLFFVGANPAISATLVNETSADFRGRVFGIATTANQTGSMLGPLLGSIISTSLGIKAVFLLIGPLIFGIGFYLWKRFVRLK